MKRNVLGFVALLGAALTLTELILKYFHSSICSTQGCILVSNSVRYSDNIIVFIGFIVFAAIFILSLYNNRYSYYLMDGIIGISLSLEGIFAGYQLFRIHHICIFCFSILFIFVILAIVRIYQKGLAVLFGFSAFFASIFLMFLLKPVCNIKTINSPMALIYKQNCPHCERVIDKIKQNRIKIKLFRAQDTLDILKGLDINTVPVLIINKKDKKILILGEYNILSYLSNSTDRQKTLFNSVFQDENSGQCTLDKSCK